MSNPQPPRGLQQQHQRYFPHHDDEAKGDAKSPTATNQISAPITPKPLALPSNQLSTNNNIYNNNTPLFSNHPPPHGLQRPISIPSSAPVSDTAATLQQQQYQQQHQQHQQPLLQPTPELKKYKTASSHSLLAPHPTTTTSSMNDPVSHMSPHVLDEKSAVLNQQQMDGNQQFFNITAMPIRRRLSQDLLEGFGADGLGGNLFLNDDDGGGDGDNNNNNKNNNLPLSTKSQSKKRLLDDDDVVPEVLYHHDNSTSRMNNNNNTNNTNNNNNNGNNNNTTTTTTTTAAVATAQPTTTTMNQITNQQQQQQQTPMTKYQRIAAMFSRMKPQKGKILLGLTALMVGSLCSLAIPLLVGKLIDKVGRPETTHLRDVKWILLGTLFILIANGVANFINLFFLWIAGDIIVAQLRIDLFKALIYRDVAFFDTQRTGDLLSRLSNDVGQLNSALTVHCAEFIQRIVIILGAFIYMFYLTWDLTLITLSIGPIIALSAQRLARQFHKMQRGVNQALAESNIVANETLSNIRTVRTLSLEFTQQLKFNSHVLQTYLLSWRQKLMKATQRTFVYFLGGVVTVGVLTYGAWKVLQRNSITSGDLMTFTLFALQLATNIGSSLDNLTNISTASGGVGKVLDLLDGGQKNDQLYQQFKYLTPWHEGLNDDNLESYLKYMNQHEKENDKDYLPSSSSSPYSYDEHENMNNNNHTLQQNNNDTNITIMNHNHKHNTTTLLKSDDQHHNNNNNNKYPYDNMLLYTNPYKLPILTNTMRCLQEQPLVFNNVSFAYPTRPEEVVLHNLDLVIQPGERIGLVGFSGSGKSTVVSLLERMYQPTSGSITIGGGSGGDITNQQNQKDKEQFEPININDINQVIYRSNVGYVAQQSTIFNTTIWGNVLAGVNYYQLHDCMYTMKKLEKFIKKYGYNPYLLMKEQQQQINQQQQPLPLVGTTTTATTTTTTTTAATTTMHQNNDNHHNHNHHHHKTHHHNNTHKHNNKNQGKNNNHHNNNDDTATTTTTSTNTTFRPQITIPHKIVPDPQHMNTKDKNVITKLLDDLECPCTYLHDIPLCQDLYGNKYCLQHVIEACEKAECTQFIEKYPDLYHSQLSQTSLSGGQQQRLSIARTYVNFIYHNTQVCLFDEFSSALDLKTEQQITQSLNQILNENKHNHHHKMTTIIIAHRLSTIVESDRIIVFSGGKILEQGTHQQLLAKQGNYAKLWDLQFISDP